MNQEIMRAIVLIALHIESDDGLNTAELDELRFLALILRRASRAQEGTELERLEARAMAQPVPPARRLTEIERQELRALDAGPQ